jgi:hypothetical protein
VKREKDFGCLNQYGLKGGWRKLSSVKGVEDWGKLYSVMGVSTTEIWKPVRKGLQQEQRLAHTIHWEERPERCETVYS